MAQDALQLYPYGNSGRLTVDTSGEADTQDPYVRIMHAGLRYIFSVVLFFKSCAVVDSVRAIYWGRQVQIRPQHQIWFRYS